MSEADRRGQSTVHALQAFKEARRILADLTKEENAFLFEAFFKYEDEDRETMRRLAFEREILKWADEHPRLIEEKTQADSQERRRAARALERLLKRLFEGHQSSLCGELLTERRARLEYLIEKGEGAEQNYRRLRFLRERAKRRFERAIDAAEPS